MTATEPKAETRRFEVEVCGRCAGSGAYSFNLIDGDMCYGCRRKGKRRTKRGQAAYDYYVALCTKKAPEIAVGDCISAFGRVCKVEAIEHGTQSGESMVNGVMTPYTLPTVTFSVAWGSGGVVAGRGDSTTFATSEVVTYPNGAEKTRLLALAYDYQDTLTKEGKPRKR